MVSSRTQPYGITLGESEVFVGNDKSITSDAEGSESARKINLIIRRAARASIRIRKWACFFAAVRVEMRQAGVDDDPAHPSLEWSSACIAIDLREYFKKGIAEHRFGAGLIIGIAQAYLQKIAVIRSENMLLRLAVSGPAAGDEIRRQNGFQTRELVDLLMV